MASVLEPLVERVRSRATPTTDAETDYDAPLERSPALVAGEPTGKYPSRF